METIKYDEVKNAWKQIARHKTAPGRFDFEIDIYKKLLGFFHPGPYYYYIVNIADQQAEFASDSIRALLGIAPEEFSLDHVAATIHPEDAGYFVAFEKEVARFFNQLSPEQVLKYKVSYDYRVRRKDGTYIRLLQQVTTIQTDASGAVIRVLGVHTDITHLKKEKTATLSFIGLEGEPSYLDIASSSPASGAPLTKREKEIAGLLAEGKNTGEIAQALFISTHTVAKHRKNMLQKTGTHSALDLVFKARCQGWL